MSEALEVPASGVPSGPPPARHDPQPITHHGHTRVDPYRWLEDADDPEVIAHLEAENAWTAAATEALEPLREAIFTEIKGRVLETDLSVPVRDDDWWYYSRTVEGLQYGIHCRRPVDPAAPGDPEAGGAEQVLLDENVEAGDAEFFDVGAFDVSPDHALLAWATTSPTASPTPTTARPGRSTGASCSTSAPTRPCARTSSGGTCSAPRPPTTCSSSRSPTSASS
jgi:oligopeptidase B